jgi:ADP-L-glycero-D-manno-heptose 6-epimerase
MIVVTGAAGFIGSCLVGKLNGKGLENIVLVDDFFNPEKLKNLENKNYTEKIHRDEFIKWLGKNHKSIEFIFHLGARTDTTITKLHILDSLNLNYSKSLWDSCTKYKIPLVYASSAATYGLGEFGFQDDHALIEKLNPLNLYGESKHNFDKWVLEQKDTPPYWTGMKFFNVYGPNEYHKGSMTSVVLHAFNQIKDSGKVVLYRSHHPNYKNGGQLRDFVYIKDLINVLYHFMHRPAESGIFNLGTGLARSFSDLAKATFKAMHLPINIEFTETPENIRNNYQYFTEANIQKLRSAGYEQSFYSLEMGIREYVQGYLNRSSYY